MQWDREVFCADVFAECEKSAMPPQILDCRFYAFVDLDLLHAGVALDVKNTVRNQQIVVELLRTTNVQNCIRIAIELPNCFQRHAGSWSAGQVARAIPPATFEIKFASEASENPCRILELVGYFECFRVVRETR